MPLFLDAPIEELKLSRRVRNALHLAGLHTLRSVLECDYKITIRGLGPTARTELSSALEANGFALPHYLSQSEPANTGDDITKLLGQLEESFQKWGARLEHFELRLRAVTASTRCQHYNAPDTDVLACRALAQQFRTQLTSIRTITAALQEAAELSAEEHQLVDLLEEQSVRLSVLVYRLFEILSEGKPPPRLQSQVRGLGSPDEWPVLTPELVVGCEMLLQKAGRALAQGGDVIGSRGA